jgi:hypothetical protein
VIGRQPLELFTGVLAVTIGMLRIVRKLLHPIAQLRRMNTKVFCGLRIRSAAFLDQSNRLKLELPRKLPSLHDAPPAP